MYYRGYSIEDLVNSYIEEERFGFEEITYLLILGSLPTRSELEYFKKLLGTKRELPQGFCQRYHSDCTIQQYHEQDGKKRAGTVLL